MKDYYKILEIGRDSSEIEIKKAYRKLALKYHPDVNSDSDATAIFKDVNEAYRTLGNISKKRHYDFYFASGTDVKLNEKYRQDKGRKYGTAYRNQNHSNQNRGNSYHRKKRRKTRF